MSKSGETVRLDAKSIGMLQPRPKHLSLRRIFKDWWLEYVACVSLLATIAATVVTIRLQQNRPLYHWPYNLSINSVVSIYSVVVKAAILLILSEGIFCIHVVKFAPH